MKTIIFQGDSVTDAGRNYNDDGNCGMGYATLVKGRMGFDNPGQYKFINRGIGGNRISDLYARIKRDTINLRPDYISFLVGVNEVLHQYIRKDGFSVKRFEELYIMMLEDIYEALPDVKIFLMEPFLLQGTGTVSNEENPGRWEYYSENLPYYCEAVKEVADKFNIPFVPLQKKISDAAELAGAEFILSDGIHPTSEGHQLIAREWIRAFDGLEG